jgi:endoglycosylceramidase
MASAEWRRWRAVAGVSLALMLAGCGGTGTDAVTSRDTMLALAAADGLFDAQGREVILRGFNLPALRSDRNHPPYRVDGQVTPDEALFELQDLEEADFDNIAATGLNVIRLRMAWEFAQPDPPPAPYNEGYFARVDAALAKARARGLYVVLDFAQFGWSRDLGGNAGAPPWTSVAACRALPEPPVNLPPHASPQVLCQWTSFWQNAEVAGQRLQDHYFALWRHVAQRYRGEAAVAAYDVLNEPLGGALPPGPFEFAYLYPFYRKLASAIRRIDPVRMIGFQPQAYHSAGIPIPFIEAIGIANSLYMPHEYTLAYGLQRLSTTWQPGYAELTRAHVTLAQQDAETFGTPQAWGEVGWSRTTSADGVGAASDRIDYESTIAFARAFAPTADAVKLNWMWANWSSISATYGVNYGDVLDEPLLAVLVRPFPRATAGRLRAFAFDDASKVYTQSSESLFDAPSEIALPLQRLFPQGVCIRGDGRRLGALAADGALVGAAAASLHFDRARQLLRIQPLPAGLRIEPGEDCAGI